MNVLIVNQSPGYLFRDILFSLAKDSDLNIEVLIGNEFDSCHLFKSHMLNQYNRKSKVAKALSMVYFSILACVFIVRNKRRFDRFLFVSNPPVLLMLLPFLRINYSILVYDLYPDAIASLGLLKEKSFVFRVLRKLFSMSYGQSGNIFCISESMIRKIESGLDCAFQDEKFVYSPLWYDSSSQFQGGEPPLPEEILELDLHNNFVITYSGNLGASHPIEDLILAADYFEPESVLILVIGSGERASDLRKMSEARMNVVCLDFLDQATFNYVLACSDIGVSCLDESFSDISIPSKTFNLLANGKPILAIASKSSELANLVRFYNAGVVVPPKNPVQIFKALQPIIHSVEKYRELATNSKKASADYSPENADIIAQHFLKKT
jgi:glycosyltransferase involved in cell wall biosynthesis